MTQPVANFVNTVATGGTSTNVFITFFAPRSPTVNDIQFPVSKRWVNTLTAVEYILQNFTSTNGQTLANWVSLTPPGIVFPAQYDTLASTGTALQGIVPGTAGQVLTSNGAGAYPSYQSLPPSGLTWTVQTSSFVAQPSNGYFCSNTGGVTVTLGSFALGSTIAFVAQIETIITINCSGGAEIIIGNASGSVSCVNTNALFGDSLMLVAGTGGAWWSVGAPQGVWILN